jgi:glycosyltransferase involved in cell wall biosynthesis
VANGLILGHRQVSSRPLQYARADCAISVETGRCGLRQRKGRLDRPPADKRPPRVALVIDAVFPYHLGGREVRYYELTRRLASQASIRVYTMHWWQGPRCLEDGDITFHAVSRLRAMYVGGQRSIRQALFFAAGCIRLLWHDFDVLDADHMPYLQILVLRVVATLKHKPLVVTWHEVWGRTYWRQYLGTAGIVAWLIEWLAMRMPDRIIAASPQTEQRLRAILGPRAPITVAPNGVDLHAIHSACPDSSLTDLIVVGRLIAHKRVDMLLDAVASLHAAGLPVTCRVVGDGPERESLHDQARALHISDAMDFRHDIREQKDLYSLIKAAKVAVFPSEREGFGAAVLEALACGIPVVTTSSPDNLSQHLVARSGRGHVCEASAVALADTIERILTRKHVQAPESDDWLADYSWDAVAARVASALGISTENLE